MVSHFRLATIPIDLVNKILQCYKYFISLVSGMYILLPGKAKLQKKNKRKGKLITLICHVKVYYSDSSINSVDVHLS